MAYLITFSLKYRSESDFEGDYFSALEIEHMYIDDVMIVDDSHLAIGWKLIYNNDLQIWTSNLIELCSVHTKAET